MKEMTRNSNFELLRIVSMFMILTLHSRFEDIVANYDGIIDANHVCKFFFEALSIVGVNLFVLISGYFGIKLKMKSIINLLWQIVYIAVICVIIRYGISIYQDTPLAFNIKWLFPVTNIVWFVPCYIMLMLFSPVLNAFIEKSPTRFLIIYTAGLYIISYYWSSIWNMIGGFGGYSWGWFIILYFTGRIINRLNTEKRLPAKWKMLLVYFILSVLMVLIALSQNKIPIGRSLLWVYDFPLVYFSSICLFMFFVIPPNLDTSKVINWLAKSAFAVLLLHMSFFSEYHTICKIIYNAFDGVGCILMTFIAICVVYLSVTIIDQPRQFLYKYFINHYEK